jgi:hypothetical protein
MFLPAVGGGAATLRKLEKEMRGFWEEGFREPLPKYILLWNPNHEAHDAASPH